MGTCEVCYRRDATTELEYHGDLIKVCSKCQELCEGAFIRDDDGERLSDREIERQAERKAERDAMRHLLGADSLNY